MSCGIRETHIHYAPSIICMQDDCLRAVKPFATQAELDAHVASAHGTALARECIMITDRD